MLSVTDAQSILEYWLKYNHNRNHSYRVLDGYLWYNTDSNSEEDWDYDLSRKLWINRPKNIITVSDCIIRIRSIRRLIPSENDQKYIVNCDIIPADMDNEWEDRVIQHHMILIANGQRKILHSRELVLAARGNGYNIYTEKLFTDMLRGFVDIALNSPTVFDSPYFVTGYGAGNRFLNFDAVKDFLPFAGNKPRNISQQDIDNIYSYIRLRPSSGMLFLYSIISITHMYVRNISPDISSLPMLSLNYCGSKRPLQRDINLFSNFFGSRMLIDYCATLDSAGYSISQYSVFKDVPVIVRKLKEQLTSRSRDLREIIDYRYRNLIGFYPVIISQSPLKIAEVLSIPCSNNRSIDKEFWAKCKDSVNIVFRHIIEYIGYAFKHIDTQEQIRVTIHDDYCGYETACFRAIACQVLDLFGNAVDGYCSCTKLSKLLKNLLDDHTLDRSLMLSPPSQSVLGKNNNAYEQKIIDKILRFAQKTLEQHKQDKPQETVFITICDDETDINKFFPEMHDERMVCIKNKLFDEFIKSKLHKNPREVKSLLSKKGIIQKDKSGKRFTRNKGAKGIPCVCFYAEYLNLSDRNDHLSLG